MNYLFKGGITIGANSIMASNLTWPFVKLHICNDSLTFIYSNNIHKIDRSQIDKINVHKGLFSKGIRLIFTSKNDYPYFVFWSFNLKKLVKCLEACNYHIT